MGTQNASKELNRDELEAWIRNGHDVELKQSLKRDHDLFEIKIRGVDVNGIQTDCRFRGDFDLHDRESYERDWVLLAQTAHKLWISLERRDDS